MAYRLDKDTLSDLLIDLWRIRRRAMRERSALDSVLAACESALERAVELGFQLDDMIGRPYDVNMVARVVDRQGGPDGARVTDCVAPAVLFMADGKKWLLRPAEICVEGRETDE